MLEVRCGRVSTVGFSSAVLLVCITDACRDKRPAGHPSVQNNSGVDRSLFQRVGHLACIHIDRSGQGKSSPQMQARRFTAAHIRPWTRTIQTSRTPSGHGKTKEEQRKGKFSPTQHDMLHIPAKTVVVGLRPHSATTRAVSRLSIQKGQMQTRFLLVRSSEYPVW